MVSQYFGFGQGDSKILGEIGSDLGVTRERVRQLRNCAFLKIRECFEENEFDMSVN